MTKIAVVGTKNGWSSEKLADTVSEITGSRILIEMNQACLDLEQQRVWAKDADLMAMDGIMIKKVGSRYSPDLLDRLEILRYIHNAGVPVFSSPERLIRVVDRLSCTVTMKTAGIPMPPTTITEDIEAAIKAVNAYGLAIVKPLYTSKARGMLLLESGPDTASALEAYQKDHSVFYIQKKIHIKEHDLGIAFLGGQYLTTYARKKNNDAWNTTTRSGGTYAAVDPSDGVIALAEKAQALFGLDFTCVDIALTEKGPLVFEVSAFGGFRGIQETRDIDPARLYAEYVIDRIDHAH
ncbi:MAG: GAK system ATP-grasp enzyme [Desulfobacterales bacterium]|nr:GAK system ATP-grasp enzyme [Desulfobacterales bacterium]